MKKLKIILLCSFILISLYTFYVTKNHLYKTNYQEGNIELIGKVIQIKKQDDKITLTIKAKEKIQVTYYNELDVKLGDFIKIKGELTIPFDNTIPNLYNYRLYLMSEKIYYTLKAEEIIKVKTNSNIFYKIKNFLYQRIESLNSNDYLKTFILGDKSDLESNMKTIYQENGISHLMAISGMHISLLASILYMIFKKNKISQIGISIFLLFYAFLVGFTPSVIRAVVFFIFQKFDKKIVLLFLVNILLLYNPYYIYNVGFLFSFIISLYLILFSNKTKNFKSYFLKLMIISNICFLASLPILINNFHSINIISPLLNLIFVPLVTFLIFPLSLLTLLLPFLDNILVFFLNCFEHISIFFNLFNIDLIMCHIPFYLIILYYLLITICLIKPKYLILLIIILLIHNNIKMFNKSSYLTVLDVGQGDCILIEDKTVNILVDTGGIINSNIALNKIIPYLKSLGIKQLDFLIISHGDYDHLGEAKNLINNFKIKKVIMNQGNINSLEQEVIDLLNNKNSYSLMSEGKITYQDTELIFLNNIDINNENEDSLILYTNIKNKNILLMGDAGEESEKYIMDVYNLPKMDILKVGHHGSRNSSSDLFIDTIKPKISLISAGKNNRYNHPHQEVIDKLDNSTTYVTSIDGTIRVNLSNLKVYTCSNVYANGC